MGNYPTERLSVSVRTLGCCDQQMVTENTRRVSDEDRRDFLKALGVGGELVVVDTFVLPEGSRHGGGDPAEWCGHLMWIGAVAARCVLGPTSDRALPRPRAEQTQRLRLGEKVPTAGARRERRSARAGVGITS